MMFGWRPNMPAKILVADKKLLTVLAKILAKTGLRNA
jgi:hypothetical protein